MPESAYNKEQPSLIYWRYSVKKCLFFPQERMREEEKQRKEQEEQRRQQEEQRRHQEEAASAAAAQQDRYDLPPEVPYHSKIFLHLKTFFFIFAAFFVLDPHSLCKLNRKKN